MISVPAKSWLPDTWSPFSLVLITRFGMPGQTRPNKLDHLPRVAQVRLGVDDRAAATVDKSRVRVAQAIPVVQDRKAAFAYLLQFHDDAPSP